MLSTPRAAAFGGGQHDELVGGEWTFLAGDLRTGRIAVELPLLDPRWTAPLNESGSAQGWLALSDPDVAALDPYVSAEPARTFLAVDLDGVILFGGPIWGHNYKRRSGRLDLAASGLWSIFDHRKVIDALRLLTPTAESADTLYAGTTLQGVARRLIAQALAHVGGDLPIVHEDGTPITVDQGGEVGTAERTYRGYELTWTGDALRNLTSVDDGPDLEFRPRRKPSDPEFIEWVLRRGTPELTQSGAPWTLEDEDLEDLEVDRDGSGMASRFWATGDGTQRGLLVLSAEDLSLVGAGFPLLEGEGSHRTVTNPATLYAHAEGGLRLRRRPIEAWTVTVRTNADLRPGTYAVGDRFHVPIADDPYLRDGTYLCRLLAINGDDEALTLTMEPEGEVQ